MRTSKCEGCLVNEFKLFWRFYLNQASGWCEICTWITPINTLRYSLFSTYLGTLLLNKLFEKVLIHTFVNIHWDAHISSFDTTFDHFFQTVFEFLVVFRYRTLENGRSYDLVHIFMNVKPQVNVRILTLTFFPGRKFNRPAGEDYFPRSFHSDPFVWIGFFRVVLDVGLEHLSRKSEECPKH